jgi:NNP family nitrate/nitrite transporter-like MFS transporter
MGLLTDRWKGRAVFSGLLLFSAIPPFLAPVVSSYSMLLVGGFFLGVAGSSFAVGVGFVSPWFGSEKQGTALGVFGLGNAVNPWWYFSDRSWRRALDGRASFAASRSYWWCGL